MDVPLTPMATLTDLVLDGSRTTVGLRLGPAAALPPTLERLHIGDVCWGEQQPSQELPPQVSGVGVCGSASPVYSGRHFCMCTPITQTDRSPQRCVTDCWPARPEAPDSGDLCLHPRGP